MVRVFCKCCFLFWQLLQLALCCLFCGLSIVKYGCHILEEDAFVEPRRFFMPANFKSFLVIHMGQNYLTSYRQNRLAHIVL